VHDLSLYLLELIENSVRAEAQHIVIGFHADRATDRLRLTVDDDGRGLSTEAKQALDPFYTTKKNKKTGLGLSLFRAEAETAGGGLEIGPSPEWGGVRVVVEMVLSHVDRPPIGDIFKTINVMAVTNPDITFNVSLTGDEFPTPIVEASLQTAREPLEETTQRLDQTAEGATNKATMG
jgi:hypothetical protein